jgi:hypothetical protein
MSDKDNSSAQSGSESSTKETIIGIYVLIGLCYAVYSFFWGNASVGRNIPYRIGSAVGISIMWPVSMFERPKWEKEFMEGCERTGSSATCECVLDKLKGRYTKKELRRMGTGVLPPDFRDFLVQTRQACN